MKDGLNRRSERILNRKGEEKGCIVCKMGKRVNGYMTLEMALVFPAVFALVIMILRQSIVRGKTSPQMKVDTSGYFMMKECGCTLTTGSEIRAEAAGQIAPALVTGTDKAVFELKVVMKARKTDPPYAFRKYRRVTALVLQALPKQE